MFDNNIKKMSLQYLGIDALDVDFDKNEEELAIKVNFVYENIIRKALSNYKWSFAVKTQLLEEKKLLEDYKYKYSYTLPSDYLRLTNPFVDKNKTTLIYDFEVKDSFITNYEKVYIEYIARVESEKFPEYFKTYIAYKIAKELCFNLTGDTDLLSIMTLRANEEYISAKNIDFLQQPVKTIQDNPFINARY